MGTLSRNAKSRSALVIVDVINPLDFPGAQGLLRQALPAARRLARLRARLARNGVPVVFVNDNFTHWLEDFNQLVAICSQPDMLGAPLVEALQPGPSDYNILKPQHSAFYNTPLEVLLSQLDVGRVLLAGIATDQCVLASAIDARMRQLDVVVVSDGSAAQTAARHRNALAVLRNLEVGVQACASIRA